jgi:2-amino-4-hydroxy-6-hydroxymethyldihydropteridine diphosphokinase
MAQDFDTLIAFGANEGDPLEALESVGQHLGEFGFELQRVSRPMRTRPVGGSDGQRSYVNAAIRARTPLQAGEAVRKLLEIEASMGRVREARWGPRPIDLDLLLLGAEVVDCGGVCVPHPRMSFRRFVLEPACEIAGEMVHPIAGRSLAELLAALNDRPPLIVWWIDDAADLAAIERRIERGDIDHALTLSTSNRSGHAAESVERFEVRVVDSLTRVRECCDEARLLVYPQSCERRIVGVAAGPVCRYESVAAALDELPSVLEAMK